MDPDCNNDDFTMLQVLVKNRIEYPYCDSCSYIITARKMNKLELDTVETVKSFRKEGIKISVCPYCSFCASKEGNDCDHVQCKCENDYCFEASCKRNPTLIHGNHYHRRQCKHYREKGNVEDKHDARCFSCRKSNNICKPPEDLIDGVYPPELLQ